MKKNNQMKDTFKPFSLLVSQSYLFCYAGQVEKVTCATLIPEVMYKHQMSLDDACLLLDVRCHGHA